MYCSVSNRKEHLLKLIDFLYHEVLSAGGDGDALWYSRFYDIKDILPLIEEFNSKLKYPWEINWNPNGINWGNGQEWALITNSEECYKDCQNWQAVIKY